MSLATLSVLLASGRCWWQSKKEGGKVTVSECVGNVVLRVELRAPVLNESSRSVGKSISDEIHKACMDRYSNTCTCTCRCPIINTGNLLHNNAH